MHKNPTFPTLIRLITISLKGHGFLFNTGSLFTDSEQTLRSIDALLQDTYCGSIGAEFTHITYRTETLVQRRMEEMRGRPQFDADKKRDILRCQLRAENSKSTCTKNTSAKSDFSGAWR